MILLTRRYRFAASHRLHTAELPESVNRELYGKCNYPYGHGHNYVLEVSVTGPLDPASGLALSPAALDRLVEERVLGAFDHRNLNADVPEFAALVPTTENLARVVRNRLSDGWRQAFPDARLRLEKIRIYETRRNVVELSNAA